MTEYVYTGEGLLSEEREQVDSTTWAITTYADFAPSGEARTVTQKGVKLSSVAAPVDLAQTKTIDGFGNVTASHDASGTLVTQADFDLAGRAVRTTDAAGVTSVSEYDCLGREVRSYRQSAEGEISHLLTHAYDAAGHAIRDEYQAPETSECEWSVERTYDASGREFTSNDSRLSLFAVSIYDARGNLERSLPEGNVLTWDFGAASRYDYNVYGQLASEYAPGESSATVTTYYPNGLVERFTKPDGSWSAYTYDDGGLKLTETVPAEDGETLTATFSYDVGGRLISSTTSDGAMTTSTSVPAHIAADLLRSVCYVLGIDLEHPEVPDR